jgi:hypothetical protein
MVVFIRMVFGDTVGLVAGGVTVGGRTMAVGNGSLARFVGFVAENFALAKSTRNEPKPLMALSRHEFSTLSMSPKWHLADVPPTPMNVSYRG